MARIVQTHETLAIVGREIGDPAVLELVVPAFAAFRRDAHRDGVCDLVLVGGTLDEFDELRFGETGFVEQRRAQARRETVIAKVAATQGRASLVDRARQKHESGEARTRIARRSPAQADRAHLLDGRRHL